MDIRVATYAGQTTTVSSANPSPIRSKGTQAASAAFQALLNGPEQATATPTQPTSNAVQKASDVLASNPDGRGSLIDILV